ncbi:MAG: 2,3-diaminopropionate biosynthesis protein SbnB [Lysobacteraceae bacterium]|nr:MAG: 2,3-diaminopropionate biosynthesis protein SbnB [Xanthomonadaceae bacterium]
MSEAINDDLILLKGEDVRKLLAGREKDVLSVVGQAYQAHDQGKTAMPADSYLRFPGRERERIISKVAWLGEGFNAAGIKWIASFPENVDRGIERASATLILNSTETGRPLALMESSLISAKRTAASAALGAQQLYPEAGLRRVGMVGCGLINFEILRFLLAVYPGLSEIDLFDLDPSRGRQFAERAASLKPGLSFNLRSEMGSVITASPVVSLATTAVVPHIDSVQGCQPNAVFLHISLRDFTPEVMLSGDNVVDDRDKVASNQTSVHLAEQQCGDRQFIRASIGEILNGDAAQHATGRPYTIYSPFGLGILDIALANHLYGLARQDQVGTSIEGFFPTPWLDR